MNISIALDLILFFIGKIRGYVGQRITVRFVLHYNYFVHLSIWVNSSTTALHLDEKWTDFPF